MKMLFGFLFLLGLGAMPAGIQAKGEATMFQNPILPGFHPDPSICRAGDDFYLVNSTFEYFPGLPIYHSKDLVNWKLIGNALDRPSQLPLKGATDFGGLYAPTIRYWKGLFYLACTNMGGGGAFIVTAKNPAGPWSEPMWMNDFEMDGSMFFDDDGKAYYTKHAGGERAGISQAEFDPSSGKLTSPVRMIYNNVNEQWNEGPHLYKIKGLYYLMLAEGGTGDMHQEVIGRSKSPWGPFEPCPYNPILTHRDNKTSPIQCTGHADLVEAPDGSWWAVFLGVRPQNGVSVLGRETFLAPVVWTQDGWPVVNGDHHVAMEMPAPKLKPHPFPKTPARDNFDAAKLGPDWMHVRNPDPANFSLKERKGFLRIKAAKETLNHKMENPAFAGIRQASFKFSARTLMTFSPGADGEEAGLCLRSNDDNHYEIGVERFDGKLRVFVRNRVKGKSSTVAAAPFEGKTLHLRLSGNEDQYQFAWSLDGEAWKVMGASPAADMSKEKAGGFTGAVIGLYASSSGKASAAHADFDWFEILPGVALAPAEILARPTPTPEPAAGEWRINSGGRAFRDKAGQIWGEDRAFDAGETVEIGREVNAKQDPELYQTERWGGDFSYKFPVFPGKYKVTLKFAETYIKEPGARVFGVMINGTSVLKDFDILKEAGSMDKAIDKVYEKIQPGADGYIRIRFVAKVQNAKICAIEVVKQD